MSPLGIPSLRLTIFGWICYLSLLATAVCLTPTERKIVQSALVQAEIAKGANIALKAANETLASEAAQAHAETSIANSSAGSAWSSAMSTGLKAKSAEDEAKRCKEENDKMRPIVAAVSGPWWFPGLNALIYGIKKCTISLLVIVGVGLILFVGISLLVKGSVPGLTLITGFFASLPGKAIAFFRNLKPKPKQG